MLLGRKYARSHSVNLRWGKADHARNNSAQVELQPTNSLAGPLTGINRACRFFWVRAGAAITVRHRVKRGIVRRDLIGAIVADDMVAVTQRLAALRAVVKERRAAGWAATPCFTGLTWM